MTGAQSIVPENTHVTYCVNVDMEPWLNFLSEQDQQVIEAAGYRTRGAATFASRREGTAPALLIIDMQKLFVGDDVPILQAIQQAPTMIGERGWRAIEAMLPLVDFFRQHTMPIFYATMQPHNRPADDPLLAIVDPLTPQPDDAIIHKQFPSAFFQTTLADDLRERGCDSVILCGNSTSGCIRAAAVDAVQHGFSVMIPHDCVFDRIEASHKVGLLDLWMKTATILSSEEILAKLETQEAQKEGSHAH